MTDPRIRRAAPLLAIAMLWVGGACSGTQPSPRLKRRLPAYDQPATHNHSDCSVIAPTRVISGVDERIAVACGETGLRRSLAERADRSTRSMELR